MKIYTRTGDKGETSLASGTRVSKASMRIEAIGTIDELNSTLGVVLAHLRSSERGVRKELVKIQHDLFGLGAYLATAQIANRKPASPAGRSQIANFEKRTAEFEETIDSMTEKLAPLKHFILPGGGKAGSMLHLARTICRRAERRLIALSKKEAVDPQAIKFVNRLSDLLFTMARFVNMQEKKKETIWNSNVSG